jgi:phosphopantetheinyl transferase (holo-ACP synthase)
VVRGDDGAPGLSLHGEAAHLAESMGARTWHLSLTHTAVIAMASAVVEGVAPVPIPRVVGQ